MRLLLGFFSNFLFFQLLLGQPSETPSSGGIEFFETKIRPVLAKHCYACHGSGSKNAMGGFFLDTREGIRKGGNSGPAVVPGDIQAGTLLVALRYEGRKMPPSGKLPDSVIADFEKWIAMGAPDPRDGKPANWKESVVNVEEGRKYWAFQNPVKPAIPKVKHSKWPLGVIDQLVLAQLESKGLEPAPDADRATWLRRVTLDLTGLVPTPEQMQAFLADRSPLAWERVVDKLLASPQFGERWGRHWLDVARYAESVGRGRNYVMPYAWRYRDWVIDAFNQDKPYDRFILEQLAGDLLPASTPEERNRNLIATGFLALGSHDLIEQNADMFRMDVVDEQINATSRAFLALTVGCARCHDHKFDPIPTADYYAMAGIFRSTEMLSGLQRRPRDNVSYFNLNLLVKLDLPAGTGKDSWMLDPVKQRRWEELLAAVDEARSAPLRAILKKTAASASRPVMQNPVQTAAKLRQQVLQLLRELDEFPLPRNLAMGVREGRPHDVEIHIKGDPNVLDRRVPRGFVQVVSRPGETGFEIGPNESGRLQLARWLARKENPLTARVMANRIWHHLFGQGIVPTVDNFGKMGEPPSNPKLLDYLAVRFMEQNWSTKKLIREIVLSRTYRISTAHQERNHRLDPDNRYFWRQNRRRLEVEAIRDSLLFIAGKLDFTRPQESPVMEFSRAFDLGRGRGTYPKDYAVSVNWRSVYVPVIRNFLPQMWEAFDFPEPSETKGRREVTTVPTQALFLVNSPWVMDQAKAAAETLLAQPQASGRERIQQVYRQVLSRDPTPHELDQALAFLDAMRSSQSHEADQKSAWARFYQALFASAEFRYRS